MGDLGLTTALNLGCLLPCPQPPTPVFPVNKEFFADPTQAILSSFELEMSHVGRLGWTASGAMALRRGILMTA